MLNFYTVLFHNNELEYTFQFMVFEVLNVLFLNVFWHKHTLKYMELAAFLIIG